MCSLQDDSPVLKEPGAEQFEEARHCVKDTSRKLLTDLSLLHAAFLSNVEQDENMRKFQSVSKTEVWTFSEVPLRTD